jgi:small subunit ribosomal protein S21
LPLLGYTRNTSGYGISGGGLGGSSVTRSESIENLLRRFKRKVQTEDIIKDVKRHSFYLKPGEKKRVKQALAQKRARKKTRTHTDERR